jgi:hypothetical protein
LSWSSLIFDSIAIPLAALLLERTYFRIAPKTCSRSAFLKVRSWKAAPDLVELLRVGQLVARDAGRVVQLLRCSCSMALSFQRRAHDEILLVRCENRAGGQT